MRVREIMTEPVETVSAWAPVDKAARFMRGRDNGCLLATRKGKITGIVTVSDLLDLLGKRVDVEPRARGLCRSRTSWQRSRLPARDARQGDRQV
jgi:signal-transduction protein with cAMP-binding, CBS, and nucleotidyltransferase domain